MSPATTIGNLSQGFKVTQSPHSICPWVLPIILDMLLNGVAIDMSLNLKVAFVIQNLLKTV